MDGSTNSNRRNNVAFQVWVKCCINWSFRHIFFRRGCSTKWNKRRRKYKYTQILKHKYLIWRYKIYENSTIQHLAIWSKTGKLIPFEYLHFTLCTLCSAEVVERKGWTYSKILKWVLNIQQPGQLLSFWENYKIQDIFRNTNLQSEYNSNHKIEGDVAAKD